MDFISIKEAAAIWHVSERRIQQFCVNGRIQGAIRFSRVWAILKDAEKPTDARLRNKGEVNEK